MNVLDAVCLILRQAGEPLHYRDIAERLVGQGLWPTTSADPAKLLDAIISSHIRRDPKNSRIYRFDWGVYGLRPKVADLKELMVPTVQRRFAVIPTRAKPRTGRVQRQAKPRRRREQPRRAAAETPGSNTANRKRYAASMADAAEQVLRHHANQQPMPYPEIARMARCLGLINPRIGQAADRLAIELYHEHINGQRGGKPSRFVLLGNNYVALAEWGHTRAAPDDSQGNLDTRSQESGDEE